MFDDYENASPVNVAVWPEVEGARPAPQPPVAMSEALPEPLPVVAPPSTRPEVSAGMGFLGVVVGGITGFVLGGIWGAGAGVLGVGAARNGTRAYQEWKTNGITPDATKAATVSLLGIAGATWLGYNAQQKKKERE